MRAHKIALVVCLGLAFGLHEAVLGTFFSGWLAWLHPILPMAVLLVILERRDYALLFGASAGLVMDSFAVGFQTLALWRLLFAIAVMSMVAERVLTNRSLYATAALVLVGRAVDLGWLFIAEKLSAVRGIQAILFPAWPEIMGTVVWDLVISASLFVFGMFVLRRYLMPRRLLSRYG